MTHQTKCHIKAIASSIGVIMWGGVVWIRPIALLLIPFAIMYVGFYVMWSHVDEG